MERPNGLRYLLVGGTRQRHFDGTNLEPRRLPENAQTPTSRVHALLGGTLHVHSGTSFGHKQPGSGDLRLSAVRRRPYGSIFQKQDAPIQNPGREQVEAHIWQPFKGGFNACLRENQEADDEFEAVHQASREQLPD